MIGTNSKALNDSVVRWAMLLAVTFFAGVCLTPRLEAQQVTQPLVAIHDSEWTRALTNLPAVSPTPNTTGNQWWETDWNYFVMPDSLKEAFRSDGTAFTVIGDFNVSSGLLLSNGAPKYPIIFSLSAECITPAEVQQFTNYVAAGGFLFMSGPAFTRNTNGVSLGDFAMANQMGIHMVVPGLTNWAADWSLTRQFPHTLVSHIPDGSNTWRLPAYSDEVNWGVSPVHNYMNSHDQWEISASTATVVAMGDVYPYLTVQSYGKGYFIYEGAFNPIVAHGGFGPGMYAYMILRNAVQWAFTSANLPVTKLSPWPYQYDAAFIMRHDLEDYANEMADIELSAQVETSNGVRGDYYLCTGTVRVDMVNLGYNTNTVIQSMRTAMTSYGATISSHNGGLKNASNLGLVSTNYDYWHWGTDEALDYTPTGYSNGTVYATISLSNSFHDIETWLSGLMSPSLRTWVGCNFNATREGSYSLQSQIGCKILGDQKISPFPHWTLSTQTPDKLYPMLSEPVSDWFVYGCLAQSLENWHPPGVQTSASLHSAIDFYYNLGTLVNFYSHTLTTGEGPAGPLTPDCMYYALNTNLHPRLWVTNGIGIYEWWLARSNVQVNVSYSTNGFQSSATYSIKGSTDPNTAIELLTPGGLGFCSLSILTNGVVAGANGYRVVNNQLIRVKVGASVTNVVINYYPQTLGALVFLQNFDGVTRPALPAGWTSSASGADSPWVTVNSTNDTGPNSVSVSDARNIGLSTLVSPQIVLPSGPSQLSFRNNYNVDYGPGMSGFDGGVLQIKIGTNAFVDILAAGGTFVSGGYTGSIATNTSSPIAGMQAWSGISDGFITTIVDLPSAAWGQTNQFQWVFGTDQNNPTNVLTGWQIDTIAITNLTCEICQGGTNAPVLSPQSNQTINEQTPLTVTNAATDLNVLAYSLINPPAGAQISQSGVITWTPGQTQSPSTNTIMTFVTDSCSGLSTSNSFKVFVKEVNIAPTLPVIGMQTVNEQTLLTVTNTATESNIHATTTGYGLISPLTGMSINSSGVFTWTPGQNQSPGTNIVTVVVTNSDPYDTVNPTLTATNTFTVVVKEVNIAPVLPSQANVSMIGGMLLTVTNTATESNIHATTTGYALVNPPTGASISTNGIITWTPSSSQPSSTNLITTVVTNYDQYDQVNPHLTATNTFNVVVSNTCEYVMVFQENFDEVTAPALPTNWTTSASGVESNWTTTTTTNNSAPNSAYVPDVPNIGTSLLVSPTITLPTGTCVLNFRNKFNLEINAGNTNDGYDGGVLEIKIGTNAFTDIVTAGGSFVAGGYNTVIDTTYGSPLAGRPAWSGNSVVFITTIVDLPPAASGEPIQLRWNCGTDNGNIAPGVAGWWIDTISISNVFCSAGPLLPGQASETVNELNTLVLTNTATEPGNPSVVFAYQLVSPPSGATISTNGIISWTPAQTQSPGTNTITTVVTDNSTPTNLSATNSFTVVVKEVNVAPTLPVISTQTANEQTLLTVTNTATESNIHAITTGYALIGPLAGMSISTNGIFTWTPSQSQSPGTNAVTVVATNSDTYDTVNPVLKSTNTFTVIVKEINIAPVLPVIGTQTVNEQTLLTVTNTATEPNIHASTTGYSLVGALAGMNISTNGIFTWTPGQNQSPSTNTVTVVATNNDSFDSVNPTLTATNTFTVIVKEVNIAPSLPVVGTQTVNEQTLLTVTNTATESNIHATTTGYALISPLTGMSISTNGIFTWTPGQNQSPGTNTVTAVATNNDSFDSIDPTLTATNTFTVIIKEVNIAPTLPVIGTQTVNEQTLLTVTNTATEPNIHAVTTGYSLVGALAGMNISTNGIFTWTPSQNQSPGTNTITVVATNHDNFDTVNPTLTATNTFTVVVKEINIAPTLPVIGTQMVNEQTLLTVTNTATESNAHAVTTGYNVVGALSGMNISTNGIFTWTPGQNQSPSTNTVTVVVTNIDTYDSVNPTLTATNTFTVIVKEVNIAPILPVIGTQTVNEQTLLTVTNTATEPNVHAVTAGYSLVGPLAGMGISTNGIFTWTPGQNQSPSTNTVTVVATNSDTYDTVNPTLTATNTFTVIVKEINIAPTLPVIGTQTVNEQTLLTVTNTAAEPNIHALTTGYSLVGPLTGMSISTNGIFTWTPGQNQSPGTNTVTVVATNSDTYDTVNPTLTATNTFTVIVKEVNIAPILPVIGAQTVSVLSMLTVTNTATEPNIHATTLGYGLISPPAGLSIDGNGIITWTPNTNQANTTNLVTTVVTNNDAYDSVNPQLTATNSFQVVVNGIHNGPSLSARSNATINDLTTIIVTNTATDNDIPLTALSYHLVSPPAGATIDTNGMITWSPTAGQSPSTNLVMTVVTDSGTPPLSATNAFTIFVGAPVEPPMILSIGVTNGIATITWSATPGHVYRMLCQNPASTNWTELPVNITITNGTTASITNACGGAGMEFYRIIDTQVTISQ